MLRIDILTLFPGMFSSAFAESIPKIAQEKGAAAVHVHDIRDWSRNKHGKVDDRPFGGGPGMVMTCQPVVDAVAAVASFQTSKSLIAAQASWRSRSSGNLGASKLRGTRCSKA